MKVCFIGLGSIGTRHIRNLSSLLTDKKVEYRIDAVRSKKGELPADIEALIHTVYYDIKELEDDYDIIFITNPTSLHYDVIKQTIQKTKHMFIEKPIFEALDYDLNQLTFDPEGIYYVACPLRYSTVIKYIRENLVTERIYSVRAISSSYLPDWRKGVDYRTIYSAKQAMGGGVSMDLIHEWDYITYLFGMPELTFSLNGHYSNLDIDSDDLAIYIAKYKDKLIEIHLDYFGRNLTRRLELYCEDYVIDADLINNKIEYKGNKSKTVSLDAEDMYRNEMNTFLNMILKKEKNDNDIRHAYEVLGLAIGNN